MKKVQIIKNYKKLFKILYLKLINQYKVIYNKKVK